jgi:hypothetical protein
LSTHQFLEYIIRELEIVETKKILAQSAGLKPQVKKWLAPEAVHAKINVDATVRKNGNFGAVAVICRGEDGCLLESINTSYPYNL